MSQRKTVLSQYIDQSIGRLAGKRGEGGFTCEDVERQVRGLLGDQYDETLRELGKAKLRDRIRDRCRAITPDLIKGFSPLDPGLFSNELSLVYPVRQPDGQTLFKTVTSLHQEELSSVIKDLIAQRKGIDSHVRALRRAERKLKRVWKGHAGLTIGEAQAYLG